MALPLAALRSELESIKKIIPPSGSEVVIGIMPTRRPGEPVAAFEIRAAQALLPLMNEGAAVRMLIHMETREDEARTFAECSEPVRDALQAIVASFPGGPPRDPASRPDDAPAGRGEPLDVAPEEPSLS